jgi:hypothetical protein
MTGERSDTTLALRSTPDAGYHGGRLQTKTAAQTRVEVDRAGRVVEETVGDLPRVSDPTLREPAGSLPRDRQVSAWEGNRPMPNIKARQNCVRSAHRICRLQ